MDFAIFFSGAVPKASPQSNWTLVREMSDLSPGAGFGLVSTARIFILGEVGC